MNSQESKHTLDSRGAWKKGEIAVQSFEAVLHRQGFMTWRSTPEEDMQKGIDLWATPPFTTMESEWKRSYQVKSLGKCPEEVIAIELERLGGGIGSGWLYKTQADFIVFERSDEFILTNMKSLQEVVHRLVNVNDKPTTVINFAYWNAKPYRRDSSTRTGSKKASDTICYVPTDEVDKISILKYRK